MIIRLKLMFSQTGGLLGVCLIGQRNITKFSQLSKIMKSRDVKNRRLAEIRNFCLLPASGISWRRCRNWNTPEDECAFRQIILINCALSLWTADTAEIIKKSVFNLFSREVVD